MSQRLEQLDDIEQRIWSELERCVDTSARQDTEADESRHEWRVAVLATTDDGQADARSIVVREIHAAERRIVFYTDARSPKVRQIEASPRGTLMFWSRKLGWQLRMQVLLAVETSGLAVSSRWARLLTTAGARDYLATAAPGSPLEAPQIDLGSRNHFAVIEAMAETIDWLELHPEGHRRALFGAGGPRWLQP